MHEKHNASMCATFETFERMRTYGLDCPAEEIGLLPEPERGDDDRLRYGYGEGDMIRLLWIRTMADAGIALDDAGV